MHVQRIGLIKPSALVLVPRSINNLTSDQHSKGSVVSWLMLAVTLREALQLSDHSWSLRLVADTIPKGGRHQVDYGCKETELKTTYCNNNCSLFLVGPALSTLYFIPQLIPTAMLKGKFHYYPVLGKDTKGNYITSLYNKWRQKFNPGSLTQSAHYIPLMC